MPHLLVFTDLDGTLLDHHTYSWQPARPALERLDGLKIPLILCSSKTSPEMLGLRAELGNRHPFIVENGGIYSKGEDWSIYAKKDGLIITGQNPASSELVAQLLLADLRK